MSIISKVYTPVEHATARIINSVAHTNTSSKVAEWGAKLSGKSDLLGNPINNLNARIVPAMTALLPIWISAFYVYSNLKSEKIPREHKIPLLINDIIVCTFSIIAGFTIAKLFDAMKTGMNYNLAKVVSDPQKVKMLQGGIKQMMAITAFTFVFRYLGPVIATPLADTVNNFLIKHKLIDDPKKHKKVASAPEKVKKSFKEVKINTSVAFRSFLDYYQMTHKQNNTTFMA